ncbi:conserved hypothetical protein [Microsporum canis CBS 113480]|uniref:Beta-lactamase-related domain-containing protein n=1 Tax=Arthroderma otae (strain ATCC MYA-4605 / CBS 113480) TaxID=554155 RepID=C5FNM8_ARTOC|nr:conserved hypothetical protein [Microsporum canis CBS 113480]EEQ31731.1 conserved hypothetical protein [Microsporum canis CBS 113480]
MSFYQSILLLCSWVAQGCNYEQTPLGFGSHAVYHPSIAFEEKVTWSLEQFKGYGVADLATSQPVSEHTLFFGGSTTKAFTAALISLLVDDNENFPEIQWDAPVHSIIPDDFTLNDPWFTTQVTIEDMLSHRSGMPRHDWVWFANMSLQEAVRKMRYLPLTSTIRTKFHYCNLMYMAAAHLIEIKTGQPFKDVLRERILKPLGMTETYVSLSDAQAAGEEIARGYFLNSTSQLQDTELSFHDSIRGAGNIITSAADYAKWVQAMIHRSPPISAAGYAAVLGGHTIISPEPITPDTSPTLYGFGWFLQGFGSLVCFLPKRKIGFVILGNNMIGTNAAVTLLGNHLIDDILGIKEKDRPNWRKRAEATLENTKISPRVLEDLYPRIPNPPLPPSLKLSDYEGVYTHPAYPTLKITTECPTHSLFPKLSGKRKLGADRLCAKLSQSAFGGSALILELRHVTGDFWIVGTLMYGATSATRGKFILSPEGVINQISIEMEPTMALEHKGIHWQKKS